jgi:hypothetical protein
LQNGDVRRSASVSRRGGGPGGCFPRREALGEHLQRPGSRKRLPSKAVCEIQAEAYATLYRLEAYATLVDTRSGGHCKTGKPDVQIDQGGESLKKCLNIGHSAGTTAHSSTGGVKGGGNQTGQAGCDGAPARAGSESCSKPFTLR